MVEKGALRCRVSWRRLVPGPGVLAVVLAGLCGVSVGQVEPEHIELAGHQLNDGPRFSYVTAFNENETIEAAIDLQLHPGIVGQTCDVYVVQARSKAEWELDPADRRPGRPLLSGSRRLRG
jgi:hypothetical protein